MSTAVKIGIGLAIGGGLYLLLRKAFASGALNPISDKNLAYSGVNAIGSVVSGDDDWTLGGWVYDITHEDPMKKMERQETYKPEPVFVDPEQMGTWGIP